MMEDIVELCRKGKRILHNLVLIHSGFPNLINKIKYDVVKVLYILAHDIDVILLKNHITLFLDE